MRLNQRFNQVLGPPNGLPVLLELFLDDMAAVFGASDPGRVLATPRRLAKMCH